MNKTWPSAQQVNDEVGYKGPHCCLIMENALKIYKDGFVYCSETNEYKLQYAPSSTFQIYYCVFCGRKLPPKRQSKK